jgi:hypothetical protein
MARLVFVIDDGAPAAAEDLVSTLIDVSRKGDATERGVACCLRGLGDLLRVN